MNEGWGSPRGSPNFCSRVHPAWVAAARRAWGPRAGPAHSGVRSGALPDTCTSGTCRSPRLYHTPSLSLSVPLSAPGAPRMLSRVYNRELSWALSKATARTGGGSGGRPLLLLSSPRPAPCSAAPPQPAGGRPQAEKRSRGGEGGNRRPGAAGQVVEHPPEWRDGALPSRGGPLPPGTSGRGTRAFVLPGLGEAALPRRSAGGAGAPGLLTFARGEGKVASSCLLGRGRGELGSRGREGERSVGGRGCVSRPGSLFALGAGRGGAERWIGARVLRVGQIPS